MLDLNFVREHLPLVEQKLRLRGMNPEEVLGDFRAVDTERRANITTLETAKQRRNELSPKIGALKQAERKGVLSAEQQKELSDLAAQVAHEKSVIEQYEERVKQADEKFLNVLKGVPNLPHDSVPPGKSSEDNVEARRWGSAPKFAFTPKPHWELGEQLGVLDLGDAAVETAETVAQRIRTALEFAPPERIVPAPDCGMKYLPRETAFGKLKALADGAAMVRRELLDQH